MLGWVRTILPSRFQFKFEKKEAPFGVPVPGTSTRSVPTLTGEGINTKIHTPTPTITNDEMSALPLSFILLGVIAVSSLLLVFIIVISILIIVRRKNRRVPQTTRNTKEHQQYEEAWKDDSFESDDGKL